MPRASLASHTSRSEIEQVPSTYCLSISSVVNEGIDIHLLGYRGDIMHKPCFLLPGLSWALKKYFPLSFSSKSLSSLRSPSSCINLVTHICMFPLVFCVCDIFSPLEELISLKCLDIWWPFQIPEMTQWEGGARCRADVQSCGRSRRTWEIIHFLLATDSLCAERRFLLMPPTLERSPFSSWNGMNQLIYKPGLLSGLEFLSFEDVQK